ncbi:hypothetical protein ABTZ58_03735 [Streptomyces sp. NPDC094143]|uniref:hypothetical protein n=1 Tax=unclassified Streptomyces TaxID=2593676 RepID=UPI00332B833A
MYEDNCAQLGWCTHIHHDHENMSLPQEAELVDPEDPAFESIARVLLDMRTAGVQLVDSVVRAAVKLGRHYHAVGAIPAPRQTLDARESAVVYYMRFGNLIKIGTTIRLYERAKDLKPDEILAVEPGTYDLELQRHRQFARYRANGEYFYPGPALREHIRQIQAKYNRRRASSKAVEETVAQMPESLF